MCGIAGSVGIGDEMLVPSMLRIMRHRGPDARGFFASGDVRLGHCRLAINDLSPNASQPFVSRDRSVAVAVNGEIYNFKDLRGRLEEKGYAFKSNSDSEVLLHGYLDNGLAFVGELNGMFAAAIWDGTKKTLFLIRDRLGIKPLYYAAPKRGFLFASEIKALAIDNDVDLALDAQSLAEYLAFENYFSNRTLNSNIKMVAPGEIVSYVVPKRTIARTFFWQPHPRDDARGGGDVFRKYLDVLESSVDRHLISDVPLGCYLSAGIDSPSVAYFSSKRYPGLKTYTGSFGMEGFYDEATPAGEIAGEYGCSHARVEIRPDDFRNEIEAILWHLDEPKVGMGAFSQYMVARAAAREVKVILTGHGGDELFAGYPVFKAIHGKRNLLRLLTRSSPRDLKFAVYFTLYPKLRREAGYFMPSVYSIGEMRSVLSDDFHARLTRESDIFHEPESLKARVRDEYRRLTLTYLRFYLPSLFVVEDKISMAFSMESRTPLCDNEMLDLALSIPLSEKLKGNELKRIPRMAMKGKLPKFVYRFPKRGFPTPLRYWFRNELRTFVKDYILDNAGGMEMFDAGRVEKVVTGCLKKSDAPLDESDSHKIWILLNLIIHRKHQKTRYGVS